MPLLRDQHGSRGGSSCTKLQKRICGAEMICSAFFPPFSLTPVEKRIFNLILSEMASVLDSAVPWNSSLSMVNSCLRLAFGRSYWKMTCWKPCWSFMKLHFAPEKQGGGDGKRGAGWSSGGHDSSDERSLKS
ncbi:hypothetical protein KIL84_009930 [Mauremys mutica]|uniref:Uncharacterized protein n=1 Tax=Mauremys mutica TaxID=74926 RepID=A0A9D4B686_9SAUR|nr:hypothetical protein KIL84_009930 [Mauremys mutica]